jgi:hypothetical protein
MIKTTSIFRRKTIELNRIFASMRPVIKNAAILTINAEIASVRLGAEGKAFIAVIRELTNMIRDLEKMIGETQKIFQELSSHSALWLKSEQYMVLYEKSQRLLQKQENETSQSPKRVETFMRQHSTHCQSCFSQTKQCINKINSMVESILNIAVRKSRYLVATARMEQVKTFDKGLISVTDSIQKLADQISSAAESANNKISDVNLLIKQVEQSMTEKRKS